MKAKYIVDHLNQLIKDNSITEFSDVINRMRIKNNDYKIACKDEITFLMHNYQMDDVEIGKLIFFEKYKIINKYFFFCELDMDLIGFNIGEEEIIMVDHDEPEFIMVRCAKNAESFLELLYRYIDYIFKKLKDQKYSEDKLGEIYEIAGGLKYVKFVNFLFS